MTYAKQNCVPKTTGEQYPLMRTMAGILLAAALLLSVSGVVQCFPGVQERAWKREVQRLSADGRPSEILSHVQTEFRQVQESRIQSAQACFLIASLLFYLGWIARTRAQARPVEPQPPGFAQGFSEGSAQRTPQSIILPAKPRLLQLRRFAPALFDRIERIQSRGLVSDPDWKHFSSITPRRRTAKRPNEPLFLVHRN